MRKAAAIDISNGILAKPGGNGCLAQLPQYAACNCGEDHYPGGLVTFLTEFVIGDGSTEA